MDYNNKCDTGKAKGNRFDIEQPTNDVTAQTALHLASELPSLTMIQDLIGRTNINPLTFNNSMQVPSQLVTECFLASKKVCFIAEKRTFLNQLSSPLTKDPQVKELFDKKGSVDIAYLPSASATRKQLALKFNMDLRSKNKSRGFNLGSAAFTPGCSINSNLLKVNRSFLKDKESEQDERSFNEAALRMHVYQVNGVRREILATLGNLQGKPVLAQNSKRASALDGYIPEYPQPDYFMSNPGINPKELEHSEARSRVIVGNTALEIQKFILDKNSTKDPIHGNSNKSSNLGLHINNFQKDPSFLSYNLLPTFSPIFPVDPVIKVLTFYIDELATLNKSTLRLITMNMLSSTIQAKNIDRIFKLIYYIQYLVRSFTQLTKVSTLPAGVLCSQDEGVCRIVQALGQTLLRVSSVIGHESLAEIFRRALAQLSNCLAIHKSLHPPLTVILTSLFSKLHSLSPRAAKLTFSLTGPINLSPQDSPQSYARSFAFHSPPSVMLSRRLPSPTPSSSIHKGSSHSKERIRKLSGIKLVKASTAQRALTEVCTSPLAPV